MFQSLILHLGDDALPSDLPTFALPGQLKICLIVFLSLPPAFGFLPSSSPSLPLPPSRCVYVSIHIELFLRWYQYCSLPANQ